MEHFKPLGKGIEARLGELFELRSKIKGGQVVTLVIPQDRLPSYLEAASSTGFKVEKIAGEGENFPYRSPDKYDASELMTTKDGGSYYGKILRPKVDTRTVKGEGYIAVSIERPEGSRDHTPFWGNLRNLAQNKA